MNPLRRIFALNPTSMLLITLFVFFISHLIITADRTDLTPKELSPSGQAATQAKPGKHLPAKATSKPIPTNGGYARLSGADIGLLAPCVPVKAFARGIPLEAMLRGCGTLEVVGRTPVFYYDMEMLKRLPKRQVTKCKLAMAYHVVRNPLPGNHPIPNIKQMRKRFPLPGLE